MKRKFKPGEMVKTARGYMRGIKKQYSHGMVEIGESARLPKKSFDIKTMIDNRRFTCS